MERVRYAAFVAAVVNFFPGVTAGRSRNVDGERPRQPDAPVILPIRGSRALHGGCNLLDQTAVLGDLVFVFWEHPDYHHIRRLRVFEYFA